jgi:dTDP-4-dehydrorhamnose 3,5-epimerase-like enzyme
MTFTYICGNSYKLNDEGGINYKYSNFKIEWKLNKDRIRLSLKDENLLNLEVL